MNKLFGTRSTALAIIEQICNSGWSFIALRLVFVDSATSEIALIGLASMVAYTFSGILRSRYVSPLYAEKVSQEGRYELLSSFSRRYTATILSCICLFSFLFFARIPQVNSRLLIELILLILSIVVLDLVRSFEQLNLQFGRLIKTNLIGFISLVFLVLFDNLFTSAIMSLRVIDFWLISNFVALSYLFKIGHNHQKSNSTLEEVEKIGSVPNKLIGFMSISEYVVSRLLGLLGQLIVFNINETMAASITLSLFFFTTIPFSVLNGISPLYLKNRNQQDNHVTTRVFFLWISIAASTVPILQVVSPDIIAFVFGETSLVQKWLMVFVLLLVAQKSYDSARSLDCMLNTSFKLYFSGKFGVALVLNLACPILLAFGQLFLACGLLIFVFACQVFVMERTRK